MSDAQAKTPTYLEPYAAAARRHGGAFSSLLWANAGTQRVRFQAFADLCDFRGRSVLDVGCGRADLLDFLQARGMRIDHYVGLEALEPLAAAAEDKGHPRCMILRGDFVRDPVKLFVGADIVVFSGSLNTLKADDCHAVLQNAFEATADQLLFNFLDSPLLAAAGYLTWHKPAAMKQFAETLSSDVRESSDYLKGDRTILVRKAP